MDWEDLVIRCTGKCKKLYRKVRMSCRDLPKRGSDCLPNCLTAVKKLLKNEAGNSVWNCGNPKGILKKLQNAYNKKC